MNNLINHIVPEALHFNRWSNKSYAIFNSIGRVVHIGFLSTIIQKLITVKSLISNGLLVVFLDILDIDEQDDDLINKLEIVGSSVLFEDLNTTSISISSDRSDLEHINIIYKKRIKKALRGPFLFCRLYTSSTELYSPYYSTI